MFANVWVECSFSFIGSLNLPPPWCPWTLTELTRSRNVSSKPCSENGLRKALSYPLQMLCCSLFPMWYNICDETVVRETTGPIVNLKGPYFQPSLCVCVPVTGTSTLQRWPILTNLVTRTLLWSSLAATIMVQVGRRGTARCLFENFQKYSKITEFEFQNSGPSFFA